MTELQPVTYLAARAIVLGDGYPPVRDGNPVSGRICYPIDPRSDLFLFGASDIPTEGERVAAQLIGEAWQQIPVGDRNRIVAFWRGEGRRSDHLEIEWAPQFELRDHWFTRGARNFASTMDGSVFFFHRGSIAADNEERIRTAAAHEFAHALQRATGEWGQQRPIPKMPAEEQSDFLASQLGCTKENLGLTLLAHNRTATQMVAYILSDDEARTNSILRHWGFDPSIID